MSPPPLKSTTPKSVTFSEEEISLYQEELRKAATRIEQMRGVYMGWLIRFAQLNLNHLSRGQWIDLGYEINVFGDMLLPTSDRFTLFPSYGLSMLDWEGKERCHEDDIPLLVQKASKDQRLPLPLPTPEVIASLQKEAFQRLNTFLREDRVPMPLPSIDINVIRFPPSDQVLIQLVVVKPQELFTYNMTFLICAHPLHIRRCLECSRIFLADRKNQVYCSVRCQARVATRKYQGIPDDRKGKRGRPPKQQKDQPNV